MWILDGPRGIRYPYGSSRSSQVRNVSGRFEFTVSSSGVKWFGGGGGGGGLKLRFCFTIIVGSMVVKKVGR